jgi:hypothetical protein
MFSCDNLLVEMKLDYKNTQAGFDAELKRLARVRERLVDSIARVDQQIKALTAAAEAFARVIEVRPDPEVPLAAIEEQRPEFEITATVRDILKAARQGDRDQRSLSPPQIKTLLVEKGWKAEEYDNPLAVIHTILKRLVKSAEVESEFASPGERVYRAIPTKAEQTAEQEKSRAIEAGWKVISRATFEILSASSKPMSAQEIAQALIDKGIDMSIFPGTPVSAVYNTVRGLPLKRTKVRQNGTSKDAFEVKEEARKRLARSAAKH